MTTPHFREFFPVLLLSFTLVAGNARGGPPIQPSPQLNGDGDIETKVKRNLDRQFKEKKFETGSDSKMIRTSLRVSAPEEIQTSVIETVTKEFKKIDDVRVGVADVDYEVSFVVSIAPGGNDAPLYIVSLVVAKSPAAVRANPKQLSALMGHILETGDQLEELCKRVATETNAHVFEQERKARKTPWEKRPTPLPR